LAKIGQNWPNVDKAGQTWTRLAKIGQPVDSFFPPFGGRTSTPRSVKQKTPALFLAGFRGSGAIALWPAGNETTKKRAKNPALSTIGRMPINAVQAGGTRGRDFETRLDK
jgi:hypothetical protein